jgi:sodium/potassium/calcium exchanger 6
MNYLFQLLAYVNFVMAVLWIYLLATEVVSIVTMIGEVSGISDTLLGLTLIAWSNSVGDLVNDLTVARQGYPRMAISACFGGPLFSEWLLLFISSVNLIIQIY